MKTLLLSAPKDKNAATGLHRTFNTILASNIGPAYAIYANLVGQITTGMKVVVFERIDGRQAEGIVAGVNPTGHKTGAGVSRYDVLLMRPARPADQNVQFLRPLTEFHRNGCSAFSARFTNSVTGASRWARIRAHTSAAASRKRGTL